MIPPQRDISDRIRALDAALDDLSRTVIGRHLDLSRPENQSFLAQPDGRSQHQTQWHQWGILTHTRVFLQHYCDSIPALLRGWHIKEAVDLRLSQPIDGVPRSELLKAAILLHDIGKFGARTRSGDRFHFFRHEDLSGSIIRNELDLTAFGFTALQAEYIAHAAEDHFVLGVLRKHARDAGSYDNQFPFTARFARLARDIRDTHPDDAVEIGVLFLGDSLAKVDPRTGPARAVSQYAVNIEVAHRYLLIALEPSV